ncbi:MAG: sigma-70 family RNA polymerase sigma factor [Ruminococcus sp.]|nr:sigma-70 family RNA polymerase sigma factor [Ruminococcus sp.]
MTGDEYRALHEKSPDKAYDALFDSYCDYVYAIVFNKLRSVASREDIEECVCDIFADIYFGYDVKSEFGGDMKGYVSTVAKRKAINAYRSLAARASHISEDPDDSFAEMKAGTDIESDHDRKETRAILLSKIYELGEPDSVIIIQKYYYGRTSNEIAEQLSMKAETVRTRAARALEKLRSSLTAVGITL